MSIWFGRVMGAAMGLFTGGPFGALVGFLTGSLLDDAFAKKIRGDLGSIQEQKQQLFYRALFRTMGRLAKADGRVSEQEIQAASLVMERIGLKGAARQGAIQFFNEGKDSHTDLSVDLQPLRMLLVANPNLAFMFLEIQLGVAYADSHNLSPEEQQFLYWLCSQLGISVEQFEHLHASVTGGRHGRYQQGGSWQPQAAQHANELHKAYQTLGVSHSAELAEVKKAYRRLMSQHHPDKLAASGASASELQRAKEKTQQIQNAYDLINQQKRRV